jgi:hypothetical protein
MRHGSHSPTGARSLSSCPSPPVQLNACHAASWLGSALLRSGAMTAVAGSRATRSSQSSRAHVVSDGVASTPTANKAASMSLRARAVSLALPKAAATRRARLRALFRSHTQPRSSAAAVMSDAEIDIRRPHYRSCELQQAPRRVDARRGSHPSGLGMRTIAGRARRGTRTRQPWTERLELATVLAWRSMLRVFPLRPRSLVS